MENFIVETHFGVFLPEKSVIIFFENNIFVVDDVFA